MTVSARVRVQAIKADVIDISGPDFTDSALGRTSVTFVGGGFTVQCRDWRETRPQVGDEFAFVLKDKAS